MSTLPTPAEVSSAYPIDRADEKVMKAPDLALYHYEGCPYCDRVRETLLRLDLEIEMRNIETEPARRQELVGATGRKMVPCLRIEQAGGGVRWLHESLDIIRFLEEEVARRPESPRAHGDVGG